MPAQDKNRYRPLIAAALVVVFLALLSALLLVYIRHVRTQFAASAPSWVFYTFIQLFNDIRDGRIYDPALTCGVFVVAFVLARRIVGALRIGDAVARIVAFSFVMIAALLLPFHLLAFISLYGNLPCLAPYNLLLVLLAALVVVKLFVPKTEQPLPAEKHRVSMSGFVFIGAGVVLVAAIALLMAAVTQQAYRGYDAMWYHLPTALMWRDWRLSANVAAHYAYHYPSNAEAVYYFFICARAFALLAVFPLMTAALGSLAIVRICRLLRLEGWAGWLAGSAFFLLPVTLNQVIPLGNDVFLAAMLLLAVCFMLEAQMGEPQRARGWLVLAALAYGCAIGTKYNAIFFAPVFAGWLAWIVAVNAGEGRRIRAVAKWGAVVILLSLLPSAFWFSRNMALHQNPLYPFRVSVLGHVIFNGEPAQAFRTDKEAEFVKQPREWFYYPFVENFRWSQSWGATFAALMYVLPIVPLAFAFGNRRRHPRLAAAHGFCFATIVLGWVTWAALTAREPRYNLFVFGVMLATGAALMSVGPALYRRAMGTLFLATLIVNCYFTAQLIGERYWVKAEQAVSERTLPGFPEAIDAAPTGTILAKPYGRFSLMLYGNQMRQRVQHTFRITSEQLTALRPVLVAESTKTGLPYTSILVGNPAYKLVCATQFDGRDYSLYQRVAAPTEPERRYFDLNRPAAIQTSACAPTANPWTLLDGKLGTGWSAAGRQESEWVELNWPAPIKAGWLEVSFFKLEYDRYRIRTRHDGKWKTVARVKHATAPGGKSSYSIDKIQLNGRPIDGLRIQADRPKQPANKPAAKPEKKIFNLVEVAGYPPLTRADIALALAMVIAVALSPFEFRLPRQD